MATLIVDDVKLTVPDWVTDLKSFLRWNQEPDFPEKARVWWLKGEVWADMSQEQYYSHLGVKREFYIVLGQLIEELDLGDFLPDGLLIANADADISGNPDATFVSHASFEEEKVNLVEGRIHGFTLLEGSPDMVLEIVSDGSVEKDYEVLRDAYFTAGVKEYWLVDARVSPPQFEILRRARTKFRTSKKQDGWLKSDVFGKLFRLTEKVDRRGQPKYRLEVLSEA